MDSLLELGDTKVPGTFALDRVIVGLPVEVEVPAGERGKLQGALRVDWPEDRKPQVSPRVGAEIRGPWPGATVAVSYGEGFNLPSFFALGNPVVGDPNLKPETSRAVDLNAEQSLADGAVRLRIAPFRGRYSDLVDFEEGPPPRLVNRSDVTMQGVEVALEAGLDGGVRGQWLRHLHRHRYPGYGRAASGPSRLARGGGSGGAGGARMDAGGGRAGGGFGAVHRIHAAKATRSCHFRAHSKDARKRLRNSGGTDCMNDIQFPDITPILMISRQKSRQNHPIRACMSSPTAGLYGRLLNHLLGLWKDGHNDRYAEQ